MTWQSGTCGSFYRIRSEQGPQENMLGAGRHTGIGEVFRASARWWQMAEAFALSMANRD